MSYEYTMGMGTETEITFTDEEAGVEVVLPPPTSGSLRPLPPELQDRPTSGGAIAPAPAPAPATGKQTWWTGDVGGMVSSFFSKLGIGEQASSEAQDAAREAAGETMGPTTLREVVPERDRLPNVTIEAEPWYVEYAPHMVIGGLGLGALITLVVVMRKR